MIKNLKNVKIKSENGEYVDFAGISNMGEKQLYRVSFTGGRSIEVTAQHKLFTLDDRPIPIREITDGTLVKGVISPFEVLSIVKSRKIETYDIIESKEHKFGLGGVISHNCEFISSDALLINSLYLAETTKTLKDVTPLNTIKGVNFYDDIKPQSTYLLGVDPATGSGNDFSVIVAFEFPSMFQVAEWRSNTMSTNELYGVLKNLLLLFERREAFVYFSVENNGVGEGVISLYEADEKPPETSEFVSEMGAKKRGMSINSKTKIKACINIREMLENRKMHIRSNMLLAEFKTYVRKRGSYAAQYGSTDDIISACLIIIRLVEEIATFDQEAFDQLYSSDFDQWKDDDWDGYGEEYSDVDDYLPITM